MLQESEAVKGNPKVVVLAVVIERVLAVYFLSRSDLVPDCYAYFDVRLTGLFFLEITPSLPEGLPGKNINGLLHDGVGFLRAGCPSCHQTNSVKKGIKWA